MASKAMESQRAAKPHLTEGKGGVAGEVADLRGDLDSALETLESRVGYPELDWLDGASITAAGGDIVLEGRSLLQGQTFDELTLWLTTSEVAITALKPGDSGFTIEVTGGGTAGSESVTKTGSAFVIDIEPTVSTANQIATAINADGADSDGYLRATSGGAGTTNAVAAAADMTGGAGDGFEVLVSGVEALPANTTGTTGAAAVDDGTVTCTVPDLTAETPARAATDMVAVVIKSNGVKTGQLSAALA